MTGEILKRTLLCACCVLVIIANGCGDDAGDGEVVTCMCDLYYTNSDGSIYQGTNNERVCVGEDDDPITLAADECQQIIVQHTWSVGPDRCNCRSCVHLTDSCYLDE
ncbi:MAG: hypothetical protein A2289_23315 [Deltaproteobacteria bacterium RIFOXYA12_FULL_58_15]|nr:MAG: hypothetical protein A2289_23315 [Deltaproteobacteria bacterium RIFOXYA12_FULL_58_15]OGR14290.1 MAG: hypothetical protein A2341_18765 [Deltaproteobacteria bacterium RIFOXYB12_FULL_58_9]